MASDTIGGRYRIDRAIGHGGMGTVWLCRDELLDREVAVKQLGTLPGESSANTARAMREARTTAALNHKNAVSIFDVVDHQGSTWLVMEYVPSRTLAEIIRDEGALSPERVVRIGAQVAAALASAHSLGITHRDVKPANILIGDDDFAKISDFGIARGASDEQLTQTGLVTGTPSYFSPEMARGAEPGPESDVWALGVTLYAAVEGRAPYPQQTNAIVTLQTIVGELAERPRHAGPLAGPIGHMMDRDPASRWTMSQAESSLTRLDRDGLGHETATSLMSAPGRDQDSGSPAPVPVPPEDSSEDRKRRGALVPVAAGLVLLLALGLGGYLLLAGNGDSPSSASQQPDATASQEPTTEPTPEPTPTPEPEPEPTPTPEPEPEPTPTPEPEPEPTPTPEPEPTPEEPPADPGPSSVEFVESYFDTVPGDTDAGYAQLAPSMRAQTSRGAYDEFWAGIAAVEVSNVQPEGDSAVLAQITYTRQDGSTSQEQQRITLQQSGDGYLIAADEVIS